MKLEIQETKQKKMEWQGNCQKISEAIALSCKNFAEEGITEEMEPDAKVAQLAKIANDLKRKVTNLEEKRRHNTHQKMLESRRDATNHDVKRIEEEK